MYGLVASAPPAPEPPRNARNNNPGNLNKGQPWQGLVAPRDMTLAQSKENRFAVFKAPEWGFRAMGRLIANYISIFDCDTVRKVITRWAPAGENNTGAYISDVAWRMRVSPDARLDVNDHQQMFDLLKAIATHETGAWEPWWTDDQLEKGMRLAAI